MKRIVLVEDHQLFADGLSSILGKTPHLRLASHFLTAEAALAALPRLWADLVLMDLSLPGMNGLEALRQCKHHLPHLPVVILSMYGERALIRSALELEVDGYLLKTATRQELLQGIESVLQGNRYFSTGLTEGLLGG